METILDPKPSIKLLNLQIINMKPDVKGGFSRLSDFEKAVAWYGKQRRAIEGLNAIKCLEMAGSSHHIFSIISFNQTGVAYNVEDNSVHSLIPSLEPTQPATFWGAE